MSMHAHFNLCILNFLLPGESVQRYERLDVEMRLAVDSTLRVPTTQQCICMQ